MLYISNTLYEGEYNFWIITLFNLRIHWNWVNWELSCFTKTWGLITAASDTNPSYLYPSRFSRKKLDTLSYETEWDNNTVVGPIKPSRIFHDTADSRSVFCKLFGQFFRTSSTPSLSFSHLFNNPCHLVISENLTGLLRGYTYFLLFSYVKSIHWHLSM